MKRKIIFYNKGHIGDLHLTRQYVRMFPKWFPNFQFSYLYKGHPLVMVDTGLPMINAPDLLEALPHQGSGAMDKKTDTIYLNTWVYALGNISYCTFQSGRGLMNNYFLWLTQNSEADACITDFFPDITPHIDYKKAYVDTTLINEWFSSRKGPCIFLCNNYTQNNQSYNDNLNFFALRLAQELKVPIYLTNRIDPKLNNEYIYYVEEILNLENKVSLNALSCFSTYCPVIIGRGSGPFTYAEVRENLDKRWFSMTFPHVACDVFNGLHGYDNKGLYSHTQDEDYIIEEIKKLWK